MTEEPRVHDALDTLMSMLDHEVVKALIRTSGRQLDAPIVADAQQLLQQPDSDGHQEATEKAREAVRDALLGWLEATSDWMNRPEASQPT